MFVRGAAGRAIFYLYNPINPLTGTAKTMVNLGQVRLFPGGMGAFIDATATYFGSINASVTTVPSLGNTFVNDLIGPWALVYVDGGAVILSANASTPWTTTWEWFYVGNTNTGSDSAAVASSLNSQSALPQVTGAAPQPVFATNQEAVASVADPYFVLDPTTRNGTVAINQFTAVLQDTTGTKVALPIVTEIQYSPLYLYPN